jgi:GAF domain-containing protein
VSPPCSGTWCPGYGIRSALGIPIRLDAGASAGLGFYSTRPRAFSDTSIAVAEGIARDASRSLRLAVRIAHLTDNTDNLRHRRRRPAQW